MFSLQVSNFESLETLLSSPEPFLSAAGRGDHEELEIFLNDDKVHSNIEAFKDTQGKTALHYAAIGGHIHIFEMLQKSATSKLNLNVKDVKGKTPLQYAVQYEKHDVAMYLLNNGVLVNEKNVGGQAAIHYAAFNGDLQLVNAFVAAGANVNDGNVENQTPLHYACQRGHLELVKVLIAQHHANVNATTKDRHLPLHFAVAFKHKEIVEHLLHSKTVVPVSALDLETSDEIEVILEAYVAGK